MPKYPKSTHRTRNESERRRLRNAVAKLTRDGLTQAAIAKKLKTSKDTIGRIVRALPAQFWKGDIDALIADQIASIDKAEAEAWEGWEKSKLPLVVLHKERARTPKGDTERAFERTTPQCGDPRFLSAVLAAVERRSRLLGLDKEKSPDERFGEIFLAVVDIFRELATAIIIDERPDLHERLIAALKERVESAAKSNVVEAKQLA